MLNGTKKMVLNFLLHEKMYGSLRDGFEIHLQWHAGVQDDPMNGAVIQLINNIKPF
jgi:hypothetical protein